MPILKLHAENIGPFDKLELDLTDGKGNAHLGPHILAGVNGSGKTTVLRTIAWCLTKEFYEPKKLVRANQRPSNSGFDVDEWREFLSDRANSRANLSLGIGGGGGLTRGMKGLSRLPPEGFERLGCVATYAPHPALRWIERPPIGLGQGASNNWLSFKSSVSNEDVQAFWVASFSRESLSKTRGRENGQANATVKGLRAAIHAILGAEFEPDVDIDVTFPQPVLRFRNSDLNFSQLAAGFNATLGWVVDYLLRQESFDWADAQSARDRPGLLLIDEIETHLHPQWQRRILNGIRAAFPNTQIIVTSHSPFVISSCPEARVHVLKLDDQGKAYLDESIDAPAGASLSANIKGIFGVSSQFGPEIEAELSRWNDLKKKQAVGRLSREESAKLAGLAEDLAERGEELASIVADPPALPQSLIDELVEAASRQR